MKRIQIRPLNIQQKLLYSFLLIILICVLITMSIAYFQVSKVISNKVSVFSQQVVNKTLENIEFYLQDITELSKNISLDDQILNNLSLLKSTPTDSKIKANLDNDLKKYQFLKSYITDITIFDEKTNSYYSVDYDYKNIFFDQKWYLNYLHVSTDTYFSEIHTSVIRGTSIEGIQTITYFKKVYDIADPTKYLCTMAIELDTRILRNASVQLNSNEGWNTFVYNADNDVMLQPKNDSIQTWISTIQKWRSSPTQSQFIKINHVKYLILKNNSSKFNWNIISIAPYGILMKEMSAVRIYLILTGILCIFLAAAISVFISRSITVPLGKLMGTIKEVEKGNFDAVANIHSGDEIEKLSGTLYRMTQNIKNLLTQNVKEEKLKRKAELTALQAQINPHFLYNTLESINWLAVRKKEMEISSVLTNLGKFFRISLSKGSPFIPLSQEIDHIQSYINIQRFRYSNKFTTEISIDPSAMSMYIPKLILQPIIENALVHGFKSNDAKGNITITGTIEEGVLLLTIHDDGVGMQPDKLNQLIDYITGTDTSPSSPKEGYGLKNIQDRIQISYDKSYGLLVESLPDYGTTIRLRLPAMKEQPEDLI